MLLMLLQGSCRLPFPSTSRVTFKGRHGNVQVPLCVVCNSLHLVSLLPDNDLATASQLQTSPRMTEAFFRSPEIRLQSLASSLETFSLITSACQREKQLFPIHLALLHATKPACKKSLLLLLCDDRNELVCLGFTLMLTSLLHQER